MQAQWRRRNECAEVANLHRLSLQSLIVGRLGLRVVQMAASAAGRALAAKCDDCLGEFHKVGATADTPLDFSQSLARRY